MRLRDLFAEIVIRRKVPDEIAAASSDPYSSFSSALTSSVVTGRVERKVGNPHSLVPMLAPFALCAAWRIRSPTTSPRLRGWVGVPYVWNREQSEVPLSGNRLGEVVWLLRYLQSRAHIRIMAQKRKG